MKKKIGLDTALEEIQDILAYHPELIAEVYSKVVGNIAEYDGENIIIEED